MTFAELQQKRAEWGKNPELCNRCGGPNGSNGKFKSCKECREKLKKSSSLFYNRAEKQRTLEIRLNKLESKLERMEKRITSKIKVAWMSGFRRGAQVAKEEFEKPSPEPLLTSDAPAFEDLNHGSHVYETNLR